MGDHRDAAPATLTDAEGYVDYSYINHLVVNGGVIACGFDDREDANAAAILAEQYPGRRVVTVDARPLFARGGESTASPSSNRRPARSGQALPAAIVPEWDGSDLRGGQ